MRESKVTGEWERKLPRPYSRGRYVVVHEGPNGTAHQPYRTLMDAEVACNHHRRSSYKHPVYVLINQARRG